MKDKALLATLGQYQAQLTALANKQGGIEAQITDAQQAATQQTYPANCVTRLPALGLKMLHTNGYLTTYKLPGAKKLVQPRRFRLMWNQVLPAPV